MQSNSPIAILSNSAWSIFNFRKELIRRLIHEGYDVVAIAPPDGYMDAVIELGVDFVPLSHLKPGGMNPFRDIRLAVELYSIFRKYDIRLAISFTSKPNIYGGIAAALRGAGILPTVNGLGYTAQLSGPRKFILHNLYKLAFRRAEKVVFQNADDIQYFIDHKIINASKATLIPGSGVDLKVFKPRETFNTGRDLTFLFSGRLVREKGVLEYIESASVLKRKYPAARFIILGLPADNPHAIDVGLIRKAEKAGHIEFPGHTDRMAEYLENVDVVVLPSWYREGIPRVLIEALAKGLPVITTDFTGCRETVEHEVNGLLIPPNDLDTLTKAMESMINMDPDARQAMGKAGRAMAESKFDVKDVVDRYLGIMEQCRQ